MTERGDCFFCHSCESRNPVSLSLRTEEKEKTPGSSIKNVEDDRRGKKRMTDGENVGNDWIPDYQRRGQASRMTEGEHVGHEEEGDGGNGQRMSEYLQGVATRLS